MSASRKKRKADGRLRPAVRRYKVRRDRARREAWLANFRPGARARFFDHVVVEEAIYLAGFHANLVEVAAPHGISVTRAASADLLEAVAEGRRWRKLRTLDGTVVAVAPPKPKKQPTDWAPT